MSPRGHILLNGDDDKLASIDRVKGIVPVRFGLQKGLDYYADEIESLGFAGISCRIHTPEGAFAVRIPLPGRHMVYNALAGCAVGRTYGLTLEEIRAGIESLEPLSGRFRILDNGKQTIIDDCYNANPVSMKASLDVLREGKGRRVAILGDMGELGENEADLHKQVGAFAAQAGIDALYCAGPLSSHLAEAAASAADPAMEIRHYETAEKLMGALPGLLREGDAVLVKASHFMQFERIVNRLMEDETSL